MLNKQEVNLLRKFYSNPDYKALKQENERLKNLVKKLESSNKELKRENIKLAQESKTVQARAVKYQKANAQKAQHIAKLKLNIEKLKAPKKPVVKSFGKNLAEDKTARRKFFQNTLYSPQFVRRLKEHYGDKFKEEWVPDLLNVLNKLDQKDLYNMIKELGLKKTYFESDQDYSDEEIDMEADQLYETFMAYAD